MTKPTSATELLKRLTEAMRPHVTADTVLVGIHTGGVWTAERLHQALGLKAPMWAAQDNEMDPTQANLDAFFAAAGPRANLWRWPNSDTDPQFAKMQQLNWKN